MDNHSQMYCPSVVDLEIPIDGNQSSAEKTNKKARKASPKKQRASAAKKG